MYYKSWNVMYLNIENCKRKVLKSNTRIYIILYRILYSINIILFIIYIITRNHKSNNQKMIETFN